MSQQIYKYKGEEFVITKPEACSLKVTNGRFTADRLNTSGNQSLSRGA